MSHEQSSLADLYPMSQSPASWITQDRVDMTDWVLHFVHEVDSRNEVADEAMPYEVYGGMAYHEDPEVNSRFDFWPVMDQYAELGPGSSAFSVLRKIVADGHIRATWAFRKGRPTIYGPRAAVCVTEMPLASLVDYAWRRGPADVGCYAVGLRKSEFFAAGGRPAIYGLSTDFAEQDGGGRIWPRKLAESCGIAEAEQYRYVSTALAGPNQIDWTHEREWRWADHEDECWCPGLPVWAADEPHSFSQALVVVRTDEEAARILDLLKQIYDAGSNENCIEMDRGTLERTSVISLEQVSNEFTDTALRTLRLEDIPTRQLQQFESPEASQEDLDKVRAVLAEARAAADQAARDDWEAAPKRPHGHIGDVAGFASLKLHDGQTPLVSALLQLDAASALGGGGYIISGMTAGCMELDQALRLKEAAVRAAQAVFEQQYPEHTFTTSSRWD